jgi:hypothetical protein
MNKTQMIRPSQWPNSEKYTSVFLSFEYLILGFVLCFVLGIWNLQAIVRPVLPKIKIKKVWHAAGSLIFLGLLFSFPSLSLAVVDFTPYLAIGGEYNDNVFLEWRNPQSDYIATLTPGIDLAWTSQHSSLLLRYAPTFTWYAQQTRDDFIRHLGTIRFGHELSEHTRLDITNTYLRSETNIEYAIDPENPVLGVRTTREPYNRNDFYAGLNYFFGPENTLTVGYRNFLLVNEDPAINDGFIQEPSARVAYWFNIRNGTEVYYTYTAARYSLEVGTPRDDFTGNFGGFRYMRRFNPNSVGSIGYELLGRNFDGPTEDYWAHQPYVQYEHSFSPELSLNAKVGYYRVDGASGRSDNDWSADISMTKTYARGELWLTARGGLDERFLEAENATYGLTKFYGFGGRYTYQFLEFLSGYADGFVRRDENFQELQWTNTRVSAGLSYTFLRWFSLSLDYSFAIREGDVNPYTRNRVMLILAGSRLWRW